jgi:hypothetical protein
VQSDQVLVDTELPRGCLLSRIEVADLDVQLAEHFKYPSEYFFLTGDHQLFEYYMKLPDLIDNESEDLAQLLEVPQKRFLFSFDTFYLHISDHFLLELRKRCHDDA